ncbi:hypothetical protein TNCV_4071441 [Trichonephila clavipes]|uniref:Uncharacterized protein n=1 Tax=Trichonephila clavipes TaxID=2585209 RepID=A0A8X6W916_TRICX|nr:hypothetical protein TNCV_4071441 [Trichonephila clavipes]
MDRRGQSHSSRCTTARDNRRIVCMEVEDRAATSRTIVQQIQSVTASFGDSSNHSTLFAAASNVNRKVATASFILDSKSQAFEPLMLR